MTVFSSLAIAASFARRRQAEVTPPGEPLTHTMSRLPAERAIAGRAPTSAMLRGSAPRSSPLGETRRLLMPYCPSPRQSCQTTRNPSSVSATAGRTWLPPPAAMRMSLRRTRPAAASTSAPGYREAPVFFETHYADYVDSLNIDLLAKGSVRLQPLGTESIENFDWVNHKRTDRSWWHRIENFVYLLPLIQSNNEDERRFVADWLRRWYVVHESNAQPNL